MRSSLAPHPFVIRALESAPTFELSRSLRERRHRDRHGLYIAEGVRFLCQAIEHVAPLAGLITCPQLVTSDTARPLIRHLRQLGLPTLVLPKGAFEDLCVTKESQGLQLLLRQQWAPLCPGSNDLWIGLESVRSPGNLGSLLRSSQAAGGTGLIVFDRASHGSLGGVDPWEPACVRATMGALFSHKFVRLTHSEFRRRKGALRVLAATAEAEVDFRRADYRSPTVLMLGDERKGLTDGQRVTSDEFVKIPMVGNTDSLNVAMAGTLLLYEAFRQRQ